MGQCVRQHRCHQGERRDAARGDCALWPGGEESVMSYQMCAPTSDLAVLELRRDYDQARKRAEEAFSALAKRFPTPTCRVCNEAPVQGPFDWTVCGPCFNESRIAALSLWARNVLSLYDKNTGKQTRWEPFSGSDEAGEICPNNGIRYSGNTRIA